jgi:hypothetical protein
VPVLEFTRKDTVPGPVPLAPELIAIQVSLLLAVQGQSLEVSTLILPFPPEAAKEDGEDGPAV